MTTDTAPRPSDFYAENLAAVRATTAPAFPFRALFTTELDHPDCPACEVLAGKAATMARVTGSVGANYSDGTHGARVSRMGWVSGDPAHAASQVHP